MNNLTKKILKWSALLSVAFSSCVALSTVFNKEEPLIVEAGNQHAANFSDYTYSGNYYDFVTKSGEGLNGDLRTQLTENILPKAWPSYSGSSSDSLAVLCQSADEDPTNSSNMIYLYTRDSVTKNAASSWNREHVWPKSLSGGNWGTGKGGTDLLHLRPTYNTVNSTRSSRKFANISGDWKSYNGSTYGKTDSNNQFEPLDTAKGDIARIIMYVWVTYVGYYSSMPAITNVFDSYNTLLEWHTMDKPDAMEGHRNDFCESSLQKNRNPFVDHPEYAWKIFGDSCSSSVKTACQEAYPENTATLTSISITKQPTKTTYYINESFDSTGMVVTGYYDDGTSKDVTKSCSFSPSTFSSIGTKTVTVSYSDKTTSLTVTVKDYEQVNLTGLNPTITNTTIEEGDSVQISPNYAPSDAYPYPSVTYSSSNTNVAQVSNTGLVSGLAEGSATITITATQSPRVYSQTIDITVTEKGMDKIVDIYDKSNNDTTEFYGLFIGAYKNQYKGIFVGDGDYAVMVFGYSTAISFTAYETYLKVTGTVSIYNNLYEIVSASFEVVSEEVGKNFVSPVSTYQMTGNEVEDDDITIASRPAMICGTVSDIDGTFASNKDTTVTITLESDSSKTATVFIKNNADLDYTSLKSALNTKNVYARVKGFISLYQSNYQLILPTIVEIVTSYKAEDFANDFLEVVSPICADNGSENNRDDLVIVWLSLEQDDYAKLSSSEQTRLVDADSSASTNLGQAMHQYDYIIAKYGLANFIKRPVVSLGIHSNTFFNTIDNNVALPIIIVVAISSLTIIGFFVYRKKRHQ